MKVHKRTIAILAGLLASGCATVPPAPRVEGADWPRYARDTSATRYSPLTQIDRSNVASLEQAWSKQLRPAGGGGLLGGTVPIVVEGVMYLPIGNGVVALEPETGREIWRYEAQGELIRRTVSWWPGDGEHGPRLFYAFGSGIGAIDPRTGTLDETFGDGGKIAIDGTPASYPPSIYGNVMVIGASTGELPRGPAGDSRAYDARTGEKLWQFHTVAQPGEVGHETWLDDGWRERSGTNMWVWYTSGDLATNTVYMTIGGPSPNYYGGDRPGDNLFGNSLVALDMTTGAYKWHFQAIHHDIWDWDLPAPPVLVDVTKDGVRIPALALTGKNGLMYILNRETGEPVHGVTEQLVAQGDVPGEWYSDTQPIPDAPRPLSRMYWDPSDVVTAEDTTPEHAAACRALLDAHGGLFFNAGPFTPFMLHNEGDPPRASINMPHNGGSNWGGSAADPARGIVYVNTTEMATIGWMETSTPETARGGSDQLYERGSITGRGGYTTFSASYTAADGSEVELPCIRPPWGHLNAVDANTGEVLWSAVLGTSPQLPEGKRETGADNWSGGPTVTAGGLVFIGATTDAQFRAFDADTGAMLWSTRLPYAAQSIPMTYQGKDGRQYVAIIASGAPATGAPMGPDGKPLNGESLITFALPE